ncbi:hypothetical protein NCCP28_20950 [Niallia sp. NCCP-28]|nr:hypothetical protein NCCP28_20950 [Niallia sp. NCCP-28]
MQKEVTNFISIVKKYSPKCFINSLNEWMIVPKKNIYFRLEDIQNELDLNCKVIAWLSRPFYRGVSFYWQK